jgi:phosphopantothenoylcysteine decarboxylase/phosphopantothenate--cysteine ligase
LKGLKVLVNAGPTREAIDPVRFISNNSSGKMGIALAETAAKYGAEVVLVLGPVSIMPSDKRIKIVKVTSAAEMASSCIAHFSDCDIAVLSAAVADYTPISVSSEKIKKKENGLLLNLKPTTDIAGELGKLKKSTQLLAGFALETEKGINNAREKLRRKNLDLIVLNSLKDKGAGFEHDTNRITIIDRNNNIDKFELKSKEEAACDIFNKIVSMIR